MARQGNNPKRRIALPGTLGSREQAALLLVVRYVGSGHHKRNPADYGLERVNPRPNKSLCDANRHIQFIEASRLLQNGIKFGLFSEPSSNGFPKYIWSVSEYDEVFEAKTDNNATGQYHGYPLEKEDAMYEYVMSEWKKRCQNPGR